MSQESPDFNFEEHVIAPNYEKGPNDKTSEMVELDESPVEPESETTGMTLKDQIFDTLSAGARRINLDRHLWF
jgi:hypothetical protein